MNVPICDSKELFDPDVGIKSFNDLIFLEYEGFSFAFSGFIELGKMLDEMPILLSLDNEKNIAYIFSYIGNNIKMRKLFMHIYKTLNDNKYKIVEMRSQMEQS